MAVLVHNHLRQVGKAGELFENPVDQDVASFLKQGTGTQAMGIPGLG
jgi:ABC-type sugar transport system ATPase subunit